MSILDTIYSRKSVRSYTGEMISADQLQELIKAANAAPIGRGLYDTIHLTIIKNQELLKSIDAVTAEMLGRPDFHPLYGAPLMILVSSKKPADDPGMYNVACSNAAIVVQNMSLAAVEMGIGTCHIWGGVRALSKSEEILTQLNLPEDFMPCCAIIFGKTEETYTVREIPTDRFTQNTID
ncbi:MAG: nitroreductase family protein [Firmicutes bacterium]|nr:nitroreductase family protein [Bacillota bacterium]